jgi:hypothetical protein
MNRSLAVLFLFVISETAFSQSTTTSTSATAKELSAIEGAWILDRPDIGSTKERMKKYEYSWGWGDYLPNATIIIDFDSQNKKLLVINGLGMPTYPITQIEKSDSQTFTLTVQRPYGEDYSSLPEKGTIAIHFDNSNVMIFDPTKTELMGSWDSPDILYRVSGPE